MNEKEKAEQFRIRMLVLGSDRDPSLFVEGLIDETAAAIEAGDADFDPTTDIVTYHDGERDRRMQFAWLNGELSFRNLDSRV
jgi:hypothetical protein